MLLLQFLVILFKHVGAHDSRNLARDLSVHFSEPEDSKSIVRNAHAVRDSAYGLPMLGLMTTMNRSSLLSF